ncbi:metal-dependent hydrolase [Marinactinospora thermotolerans]|uniref:LexA-binding, inner membrane-associated putative hydrolase n=1 Tax=Marinactinospora thermotolerans DSM 45154 TaxID=1122192 RepID=A0A1T4M942_9ACTN|nr:metal-dependent hydrolase [Marinactinospora thermotolerans]SJZ63533.1 LexA-binding, inner membrane-associated putative hydrolase [Marinactinospora thermotolerans DSM 45154]
MMGHSHALSGVVGWMAIVPLVQGTEILGVRFDLGPGEIIAGSFVCAGAALLPDLDHKSATITQTYGVVTKTLGALLNWLFGGHRNGTHSFLFALIMGVLTQALALWSDMAVQVFVFLLTGIALNGLGFGMDKNRTAAEVINAMGTAGIVLALYTSGVDYSWMGLAVAFGCLLHFAGDMATEMGVPLLWPASKYRFGKNMGFKTDGPIERKVITPLLTIAIVLYSIYLFPWAEMLPEA